MTTIAVLRTGCRVMGHPSKVANGIGRPGYAIYGPSILYVQGSIADLVFKIRDNFKNAFNYARREAGSPMLLS